MRVGFDVEDPERFWTALEGLRGVVPGEEGVEVDEREVDGAGREDEDGVTETPGGED